MFLRLQKIFSTASGSLLDPNSVVMIDCWRSDNNNNNNKDSVFASESIDHSSMITNRSDQKQQEALRYRRLPFLASL